MQQTEALTPAGIQTLLAPYNLGTVVAAAPLGHGTVQVNYRVETTTGRFVLRIYQNRSVASVQFELDLLQFLLARQFPCTAPVAAETGRLLGTAGSKPCVLFHFIDGEHIAQPTRQQWEQLIALAAQLHTLTQTFHSDHTAQRWNYSPELCRRLATDAAAKLGTPDAQQKLAWLSAQLAQLELPASLPLGICHCDFHFANVLFQHGRVAALLDFDDANQTYLLFDLVGLVEAQAWPYPAETLDLDAACRVVATYAAHRPLTRVEQRHFYDVFQLGILFDCVWYFARGGADDFYEQRKIAALQRLGRERFFNALFAR